MGQALGGILKRAGKQALPIVGRAIGGHLGGASGADMGGESPKPPAGISASSWRA